MAKRGRGSKIVTSFVKHGHQSKHPGFAVNTFPDKGRRKGRSKRYS